MILRRATRPGSLIRAVVISHPATALHGPGRRSGNLAPAMRVRSCKICPMATRLLTLCLLAAASLCWGVPALAHAPPEPVAVAVPLAAEPLESHVLSAGGGAPAGLWTALAAAGLLAVAVARRRRAVALLSVAVLLVFAFEAGMHSVHHIGERDNTCVVAFASAQTTGITIASIAFERPAEMPMPVAATVGSAVVSRLTAPDRGRAPPLI